jgi:hypothetical protein
MLSTVFLDIESLLAQFPSYIKASFLYPFVVCPFALIPLANLHHFLIYIFSLSV